MAGHLFIVNGDLTKIACDAILIPTDEAFTITRSWRALLAGRSVPKRWTSGNVLPLEHVKQEPWIWLGNIGQPGNNSTFEVFEPTIREFVEKASYTDPVSLAGQAREIIARIKGAGVTTILFAGDPLAPQTLTENAQQQDYHPEWIITGAALVDTNIFGRTYQQEQWSRAFGPSNLFARALPTVFGPQYLHKWFVLGY
jgi:hypothetical protein